MSEQLPQPNNSGDIAKNKSKNENVLYSKIGDFFNPNQFYRAITENSENLVAVLTQDEVLTFLSPSIDAVLGYKVEEVLGLSILSLIHPRSHQQTHQLLSDIIREGVYKKMLLSCLHKDKKQVCLELNFFFSFEIENRAFYSFVFKNISTWKQKEKLLIRSRLKEKKISTLFKKLCDASPDLISLWSAEGKPLYYNNENPLGYNYKTEAHILSSLEIIHPQDVQEVASFRKDFEQISFYTPPTIEYRVKRKDGHWEWIRNSNIVIERNQDGYPSFLLSSSVIITDLKNTQQDLEHSRSRLEAILENTKEQIWSVDKEYRITAANSVFINMYKQYRSQKNPIGQVIFGHLQEDKDKWEPLYQRALRGETFTEVVHYTGESKEYYLETSFNPIIENGEVQGVACFNREITDLKQTEADLRQLNFELDSFVYRSSHDMLAPLKSILGLVSILRMDLSVEDREKYLLLIEKSIKKLDTFIGDLTSFSRNSRMPVIGVKVDFEEIVYSSLENLLHMEHAERLKVKVNSTKNEDFYSDKSRLEIIFQNFISNAIKYQRLSVAQPELIITISCSSEEAIIEVKDNGKGIREEYLPKIFDMFFRASEESYGSGLGLYITMQAIEKLKGKILKVESTYGEGTTFLLSIPQLLS